MTSFAKFSTLVVLLGLAACDSGDPGAGSTGGPGSAPANVSPSLASAGDDDAGSDAGSAPSHTDAPADASAPLPVHDAAPVFQNPAAGDGACTAPNLVCGADGGDDAGPACVDVSSDSLNCGACGNQCMGPSATCIAGACACMQLGFLYCAAAGGCVDTTTDLGNCGACGSACDPTQFNACVASLCVSN